MNCTVAQVLCVLGTISHALSFSSSSFVEEEHQTWYFYWITLIVLLTYDASKKFAYLEKKFLYLKSIGLLLVLLLSHRILRKLNSTGDKYAHLPDISGWLVDDTSKKGMTIILALGLISVVWLDHVHSTNKHKFASLILNFISAGAIYSRHASTDQVIDFHLLPK